MSSEVETSLNDLAGTSTQRRPPLFCHSERSRGIAYFLFIPRGRVPADAQLQPVMSSEEETSLTFSSWHAINILTNKNKSVLYIGMTNSLARRVYEHRSGEIRGFAAHYQCRSLIYYEHYREVQDAIARETQLKKWSRSKKVALIERMNRRWDDLAPGVLGER